MTTLTTFTARDVQIGLHALADACTESLLDGRAFPTIAESLEILVRSEADVLAAAATFGSPVEVSRTPDGSVRTSTEIGFGAEVASHTKAPWSTFPVTLRVSHLSGPVAS